MTVVLTRGYIAEEVVKNPSAELIPVEKPVVGS
jgi:hypothetical protein